MSALTYHGVYMTFIHDILTDLHYIFSLAVVASYEVTKKRTFLVFFIFTFINVIILLGMVVLYPKLGTKQSIFKSPEDECSTESKESGSETDDEATEQTKLAPEIGN